jgi:selenocysteine lyase/cysteine desulfurase
MSAAASTALGEGTQRLEIPSTYLAYASVAPPSAAVRAAVAAVLQTYAELGNGAFALMSQQRDDLRHSLGQLLGTGGANLALVPGTTFGIRDLALSMPWRADDEVVLFSGEFPANVTPWQQAAELFGLRIHFISLANAIDDEDSFLLPLATRLARGVRLVAVSAVQFQSGLCMPLARIAQLCKRYGAELAVDAIQACGVVPVNVEALGVDYLTCGAHKWLMGVEGAGFLYAAPACARRLVPRTAGWLSHEDPFRFLMEGPGELRYDRPIQGTIRFLEGASVNALGYAALGAAIDPLLQLGPGAILRHVNAYLDALEPELVARGFTSLRARQPDRRSAILSLRPPSHLRASDVVAALRAGGVVASMPEGLVRLAPHYPNPLSEVAAVVAAFDEALRQLEA